MKLLMLMLVLVGCAHRDYQYMEQDSNLGVSSQSLSRFSPEVLEKYIAKSNIFNKVMALCHLGKESKGLKLLASESDKLSKDSRYWITAGNCQMIDGNYTLARAYYDQALTLGKKNEDIILNNIAVISMRNNQDDIAESLLKKSLDINSKNLTAKLNLAQLQLKYGHIFKARQNFTEILKVSPNDVDVLAGIAATYVLEGKYNQANAYYQKINSKNYRRQDIGAFYALTLNKKKNIALAKKIIENTKTGQIKEMNEITEVIKDRIFAK